PSPASSSAPGGPTSATALGASATPITPTPSTSTRTCADRHGQRGVTVNTDTTTPTAAEIRAAVLTVRDLTIEALAQGPQTPRSADLSGMPRGGGGIDRPLPGGTLTSLLGPYSEPTDDHPYEPDDSPVVAQTIVGWARTIAGLRYVPAPRALGPSFTFLVTYADFIAAQPALAVRFAREVESVTAALHSVVLP